MNQFRDLRADEIDVRVATCSEKGVSLLLYKNARVDMNILDEELGQENWQRKHEEIKGNVYCSIGIRIQRDDDTSEWVWKQDCGTESFSESEKGEASDSFKRAGFNWGIGRELYTAPFIWVDKSDCNIKEIEDKVSGKKKYACYDKFYVETIRATNKKIDSILIRNKSKDDIFAFIMYAKDVAAETIKYIKEQNEIIVAKRNQRGFLND